METLDQEFENWVRARHLKECAQCQREGKAKLMDTDAVAVSMFREFYNQKNK